MPALGARAAAVAAAISGAAALSVVPCNTADASQVWALPAAGASGTVSGGGYCLAVTSCAPQKQGPVTLVPCGSPPLCPGAAERTWTFGTDGTLASAAAPGQCVTLASTMGPGVNLWDCTRGATGQNDDWAWNATTGQLRSLFPPVGDVCLQRGTGPGGVVVLNASNAGLPLFGIGGLAAVGGARLIYEYEEPMRSLIMDLLWNESAGGSFFHILKVETEGDVDSSYGSAPSFAHNPLGPGNSGTSFNRGIYLPWLVPEARARNPELVTYSLLWGAPAWVANNSGGLLTDVAVDYKLAYLEGVQKSLGLTYDVIGVWNERAFSRQHVKDLRQALDAAGFNKTIISVNDGTNGNCADCHGFPDATITTALAMDPAFAQATGMIGLHSVSPLPSTYAWRTAGKVYIQSESNIVDGPYAQHWAPNAASAISPALSWPRSFLTNYIQDGSTGTIICPLQHAWTWLYGRHNHGTALFIEPWSGHIQLGDAWWTQAHFTQATRPGWLFLEGSAMGAWSWGGSGNAQDSDWLVYTTLMAPDASQFSIIAINVDYNASATMTFQAAGPLLAAARAAPGGALATWTSVEGAVLYQGPDLPVPANGSFTFTVPPLSIVTLTTLRTMRKADLNSLIPPKAPFPLPYAAGFAAQPIDRPGRMLSDLFGGWHTDTDPTGQRGVVFAQAAPVNPGAAGAAWLGGDEGAPFTSLPAPGTAFANANISVDVMVRAADVPAGGAAAYACGRVPIWQPANWRRAGASLGVCLGINTTAGGWSLVETTITGGGRLLGSGALPAGAPALLDSWHSLSLAFADDSVQAVVDGAVVATVTGLRVSAGGYGLGCNWHLAYFDALTLGASGALAASPAAAAGRTPGSWLFDMLPGELLVSNFSGYAGFILDLTAPGTADLQVTALGRFRMRGNGGKHVLDVIDAATGASVLPPAAQGAVVVDLSAAGCPQSDLLGFCYAQLPAGASPLTLRAGGVYYVVSQETAGGDAMLEMYDPAAGTTHAHRDGTTLLWHAGDGMGSIPGRVSQAAGAGNWTVSLDVDTMFGPLNLVLVQ